MFTASLFVLLACGGEAPEAAKPTVAAPPPPAEAPAPPPAAPAPAADAGAWPASPAGEFASCHREADGYCQEFSESWAVDQENVCTGNGGVWAKKVPCKRDALISACDDPKKVNYYAFTQAGADKVKGFCLTGTMYPKAG